MFTIKCQQREPVQFHEHSGKISIGKRNTEKWCLLTILHHFTVLPAETAKCFIGLNDINITPSLECESYYYRVCPYFCDWGKESYTSTKPHYYLCIGSLEPTGTPECEKSEIIFIYMLFSQGWISIIWANPEYLSGKGLT